MTEFHPVSIGKSIEYNGYLKFSNLWKTIRNYMEERGYTYLEKQHNEIVGEEGKDIFIEVDVDKELSDYTKSRIVIRANTKGLRDVEVETEGKKQVLNDAHLRLEFDTYILTDYEGRYTDKPGMFFLRVLLEKFVWGRTINKFKHQASKDQEDLIAEIKAHLNLFRIK